MQICFSKIKIKSWSCYRNIVDQAEWDQVKGTRSLGSVELVVDKRLYNRL